jgi:membrane-bound inhibitor of C-type lysozyme
LLTKGLKKLPEFEKNFNTKWFEEDIIFPYRNILKKYAIVETEIGNQKLFDENDNPHIFIPKDSTNIETQNKIYDLSTEIFPETIPLQKYAANWASLAWKECGLFKIKDLCRYVENKKNINELSIHSTTPHDWMNKFLLFIKKTNEVLFKEYKLIPNRNGDFVSLENEKIAEGQELTDYMIDCLRKLGNDLKPNLLDSNIDAISLPLKIDSKAIAEKINEQVSSIIAKGLTPQETLISLLPLFNIIPTDESKYNSEFVSKQRKIHNYTKNLYLELQIEDVYNNDIPECAWQVANKWLIAQLMKTVSEYENIDSLPLIVDNKIEWINTFISFVSKEIIEGQLDECAIIPNQKGNFRFKKNLSKDMGIPEELKTERAEKFGIKLKDNLLHKNIDSINITNEKNINTVIEIVSNIFKENKFEEGDDSLEFTIFLVHFLPIDTTSLLYNSQHQLLDIVNKYYYNRSKSYQSTSIACTTEDLWIKANDKICSQLISHIEQNADIKTLKEFLSGSGKTYDDGDTIIFLNDFYDYLKLTKKTSGKIVPNQNGTFCSLDNEFYKDDNIPEQLKDILYFINPTEDFRKILAEKTLSIQPNNPKKIEDIALIIDNHINNIHLNNRITWEDENFKKAISLLMMEWFPKQSKEKSKEYFPHIYKKKETIEMDILWSLEDRQRMQRARSIAPELLDKFIEQAGEIDSLEKEKKQLEAEIAQLKTEAVTPVINSIINEIVTEFPNITADKIRELLKMEERIKGWTGKSDYQPETVEEEKRNYDNGYKGEAYVYKQLIKSGEFRNVTWAHKSEMPTNIEIVDFEGTLHYVADDYSKYDLAAETVEGKKIYIEVKSTRTTLEQADTIALPISSREWNFVNQIDENEKYCLARVFDVENKPEGHYLSLMGIGISSLI